MRRDVCNSGDVIGRGEVQAFARRHSVAFGMQKSGSSERTKAVEKKGERERKKEREEKGNGKGKRRKKEKKKIWARIEIARETDNELSGSARFRAKIQWLNRVIKSRRRLTTTSRRLPFVQPNFLPFYSLLVINRQWLLIKFIALRWIG